MEPPAVLLLTDRHYPLDFPGGELKVLGTPLFIGEVPNSPEGTGLNVWDGAVALVKYLEHTFCRDGRDMTGMRVVELGAGCGVVGLGAALMGADVWLSDLSYCLDNARANARRNAASLRGAVRCVELDWFHPEIISGADLVVGADVVCECRRLVVMRAIRIVLVRVEVLCVAVYMMVRHVVLCRGGRAH
jgi:hypothetical protein